jgi:hypothetical protein
MTYPLDERLLLCLLAVLAGAECFTDIALFRCQEAGAVAPLPPVQGWHAGTRSTRRYPGRSRLLIFCRRTGASRRRSRRVRNVGAEARHEFRQSPPRKAGFVISGDLLGGLFHQHLAAAVEAGASWSFLKMPFQSPIRALMLLHAARRARSPFSGALATRSSSNSRPLGP